MVKNTPVLVQLPAPGHEKTVKWIRRLVWAYMILWVFEGALRKWIVPQLSDPLLIIRDPVLIMIYILAFRARCFPRNGWIVSLGIIAALSWVEGILVLLPYVPIKTIVLVTGFGFRSNFIHLPLVFVIGAVFNQEDLKRVGLWTLLVMIPMGVLMALQFRAAPESFINKAAGVGEGLQIQAAGGKIRPPGTFSFISGPIYYVSLASAFAIYGALSLSTFKTWLVAACGGAIAIAIAVSGSRSCVASVLLVVGSILIILLVRPDAVNQFGRYLLIGALAAVVLSRLPIFKEGIGLLSERFTSSAEAADTTVVKGMVERIIGGFTEGLTHLYAIRLWGYGLGIGTMGGAHYLVGRSVFLLPEGEWTRVLMESGPVLGLTFLFWRTAFTVKLFLLCFRALKGGQILALLLFSAGFVALLNGQLGQPTSQGFAMITIGLCLAALTKKESDSKPIEMAPGPIVRPLPRLSQYASQLHSRSARSTQGNGSADR